LRQNFFIKSVPDSFKNDYSLLIAGADPNQAAKDQLTPLLAAIDFGHKNIVELLIARGSNVHVKTKTTNAVLLAQEKGHCEIEEVLKSAGASDNMGLWFNIRKRISKMCTIKG